MTRSVKLSKAQGKVMAQMHEKIQSLMTTKQKEKLKGAVTRKGPLGVPPKARHKKGG